MSCRWMTVQMAWVSVLYKKWCIVLAIERNNKFYVFYTIYKFIFKHGKGQSSSTEIQIEMIARSHISPAWWAWVWYGDAQTLLAGCKLVHLLGGKFDEFCQYIHVLWLSNFPVGISSEIGNLQAGSKLPLQV